MRLDGYANGGAEEGYEFIRGLPTWGGKLP
jgi:hypothetical protein